MTDSVPGTRSNSVFVLDGGFSTQLAEHVGTTADGDPLWSARFLQTHPNDVLKTHLDFLGAGSDIISTNTYQASVNGFVKHLGVTPEEGKALIQSAVSIAKKARDIYLEAFKEKGVEPPLNPNPLIAGSVGAYGAFLNDGSEYSGNYADKTPEQIMREWHKPRIEALIEAGVDLLAFETIPCQKEAEVLVELLKDYPDMKAWLCFNCKDDKSLAHGEDFKTAANKCYDMNPEQLMAVGANCCSPLFIENLFKSVNEGRTTPIPLITYPNSGEKYTPGKGWVEKDNSLELHTFVLRWLDLGVRFVGGCCRTDRNDIALIGKQVDKWLKNNSDKHETENKKVFGISVKKKQRDDKMKNLIKVTEELKEQNLELTFELSKLKKEMGKLKDEKFSDYLTVMRERDARYTLYFENLGLQMKLKELDGSSYPVDQAYGDPVVLRIALDRCREQLSTVQTELKKMTDEYSDTVPRREFDTLEARHCDVSKALGAAQSELRALQDSFNKMLAKKKSTEEELFECKERCSELERAGTPRPQWELCADFISGGRDRWWQLASGLTSREVLRVLLKELGPAAESDHLEYFDGLGTDPAIPPYLRWSGRVRNLRLSRRELCVLVNDIWRGKEAHPDVPMQDYLTNYFADRYQQPSMRAEWAYNLCASAEQALDEPQLKIFLGVLHGALSERVYWGLRDQWRALRDNLYRQSKDKETITMEEFEKVCRATFPLKSEVDVRSLAEAARRRLKARPGAAGLSLDKLFLESEEGFLRGEVARELHRARAAAQHRYLRELVAALGGPTRRARDRLVTVDALKRALAIVDPAIDHIRMERYIRWALGAASSPLESAPPAPLHAVAARLAAGDVERAGPRYRASRRH